MSNIMNDQSVLEIIGEQHDSTEKLINGSTEVIVPIHILSKEEAGQRLNMFGRTEAYNSFAYLKISAVNMHLTNIDMVAEFKYLLYVDVSDNNLRLEDILILCTMKYIILIQADRNLLQSASLSEMPYIQILKLNQNSITDCKGIRQPSLCHLEMSHNQIGNVDFEWPLESLDTLVLANNSISTLSGLNGQTCARLDSLYMADNQLTSLNGLQSLINLRILHLRSNPIDNLDYFDEKMTKLKYLNLRSCKIYDKKEFKKLEVLISLVELIIKDCPAEQETEITDPSLREEIVAWIPNIKRIDKDMVTQEERSLAYDLRQKVVSVNQLDIDNQI